MKPTKKAVAVNTRKCAKWREKNREKANAIAKAYRARKRAAKAATVEVVDEVLRILGKRRESPDG